MIMMISSHKKNIRKQLLKYTLLIRSFFSYSQFNCPNCSKSMINICYIPGG